MSWCQNWRGFLVITKVHGSSGAAPPYTRPIRLFHENIFPGKLISRRDGINWPPRSPDLTPVDFFMWDFLKSKVYNKKTTSVALLNKINEIAVIRESTCRSLFGKFTVWLNECHERKELHSGDMFLENKIPKAVPWKLIYILFTDIVFLFHRYKLSFEIQCTYILKLYLEMFNCSAFTPITLFSLLLKSHSL